MTVLRYWGKDKAWAKCNSLSKTLLSNISRKLIAPCLKEDLLSLYLRNLLHLLSVNPGHSHKEILINIHYGPKVNLMHSTLKYAEPVPETDLNKPVQQVSYLPYMLLRRSQVPPLRWPPEQNSMPLPNRRLASLNDILQVEPTIFSHYILLKFRQH